MYVVKYQQILPEGDWMVSRDIDGVPMAFSNEFEAQKCADNLLLNPRNQGYRFQVFQQCSSDKRVIAALNNRDFKI